MLIKFKRVLILPLCFEDFQEKLFKLYKTHVRKVHPLPRLHKKNRNVSDIYVSPWMTVEIYNEESKRLEQVKISTHQIFRNDEKPAKNIYVIGEAGSGKSTFCKMLVHFWCIAHPYQECRLEERDIAEEMRRFNFLFYISLRHFSDCNSIEEMLKKSYSDPALADILQNESGKCLIVLDGLDEWNQETKHNSQFLTPGLPGRELDADYTIITTTRQWKFDALPISDSEVDKEIKLNGIDRNEMKDLTIKTVESLNDMSQSSKNAEKCITDLRRRKVSDISHTPLVLQQLVCLWFNDKLQDNSMCDIYRSILDLFLEWKSLWTAGSQDQQYAIINASRNTCMTQYLSILAYKTLFDKNKETTLTFSSSTLIQLNIPCDVIKDYLASGILKEERNVSLTESTQSSISFLHKSMQEYLAAVYIASQFKEMLKPQMDELGLTDVCKMCIGKYFGNCKTVVEILEQSNVLSMLCGLEPRLLTNVSEYIYNITLDDKMVAEERNKIYFEKFSSKYNTLIKDIQTCIFKCTKEVVSVAKTVQSPVYIADIYINSLTEIDQHFKTICFKNVLSIEIMQLGDCDETDLNVAVSHLSKCDRLKAVKFESFLNIDEKIRNDAATILEKNVRTIETVSLRDNDEKIISCLVSILPTMERLTLLKVWGYDYICIPHNVCLSLCTVLKQTTNLQHICIHIKCQKNDQHMLNLSKHKQLQHVDVRFSDFCLVSCNTDTLETCGFGIESDEVMNQVCKILFNASKLKHLDLHGPVDEIFFHIIDEIEYTYATENLIRLLSSLVSLSTLTLRRLTFTDNIIACPSNMKNLKEISLSEVKMSMSSWCKFIDSLPNMPQEITVRAVHIYITDEFVFFGSKLLDRNNGNEKARQYVREKTNLFRVVCDDNRRSVTFLFTTKKTRVPECHNVRPSQQMSLP